MSEKKKIASVSVITDTDNGYDNVGDVEGGFDDKELLDHLQSYGPGKICETLAYMQWQVWNTWREMDKSLILSKPYMLDKILDGELDTLPDNERNITGIAGNVDLSKLNLAMIQQENKLNEKSD
jgi:hypothetical protein